MTRKINGMNPVLWLCCSLIIIVSIYLGAIPNDMVGAVGICFGFGAIIVFVGDRIPVWKTFFGGGILLCMFGGSALRYFGLLPEASVKAISNFIGPWGWMNTFCIYVIVGSVLSIDRSMLIKSVVRYIPCIIAGCIGAAALAILAGTCIGMKPAEVLAYYILPIMSGGSGAGAMPLAQMFSEMTGADYGNYITIAMVTLTLGDIFAVLGATFMGRLSASSKKLNGDGRLMVTGKEDTEGISEIKKPSMEDLSNCLIVVYAVYMLSSIFSTKILPSIAGAKIHVFAYAVIFSILIKLTGILPDNIVSGLVYCQTFFVRTFVVIQMFCCGVAYTDMATLIQCLTSPTTLLLCLSVDIGAILGSGLFGYLVGFYPYEAAITAGLCMANAGGSGDVALLGATKRMNLMPYAQISSRIGNVFILIGGSVIFAMLW